MPPEIRHQVQWYANKGILKHLVEQNKYPDWIATVAFYTALHSIERFLARHKEHPKSHTERDKVLAKYMPLLGAQIVADYEDLKNTSRAARYNFFVPTDADIQDILERLARIDAKVASTP